MCINVYEYKCKYTYMYLFTNLTGTLDDGRWWDTLLVSWGLLEAGEDPVKLVPTMDRMI